MSEVISQFRSQFVECYEVFVGVCGVALCPNEWF